MSRSPAALCLLGFGLLGAQTPALAATLSEDERDAAAARYAELLRQIDDMDRQAEALDQLIERTENLERNDQRTAAARLGRTRARGTDGDEPPPAGSAESDPAPASAVRADAAATRAPAPAATIDANPPLVAATARREAAEAQTMPALPRVSTEVGGVLTPRGRLVIEPSWSYSFSSVNRVAIEGFTILPALLIGVIDVVEADRETNVASFSGRYGITDRLEMDLKGSYVRRNDTTRSREFLTDAVEESTFNAKGSGPGDYELGLRYQFSRRSPSSPYLVGNLRYKHNNGSDPFRIARQSQLTGDPQYSSVLPTGSGFKSLSPSITMIYPTDPVVFFGSLGYLWTEADDKGTWTDGDGGRQGFGLVDPGDAWRLSLGLGLGLNDRASVSISYQLDQFSKTYIETAAQQMIAGSDVTVGKLLFGYSMRMKSGNPLNLAFGIGATGDAPDTDLSFRMPISFD